MTSKERGRHIHDMLKTLTLREENIFSGKVGGIEIPKERSIDIDDEIDFFIAESLSKRNDNYEK